MQLSKNFNGFFSYLYIYKKLLRFLYVPHTTKLYAIYDLSIAYDSIRLKQFPCKTIEIEFATKEFSRSIGPMVFSPLYTYIILSSFFLSSQHILQYKTASDSI